MRVKIIPKSIRARNRMKEHGEEMILVMEHPDAFMVRSIDKTYRGDHWMGWFQKDKEATYERVEQA